MKTEMKPVAILFDFDGVIVDSYALHRRSWEQAYQIVFKQKMPDYRSERISGTSPDRIARFLARKAGDESRAACLVDEKFRLILGNSAMPPLYKGVGQLFDNLDKLLLPYAIVSNARRDYVKQVATHYELAVHHIFGLEDYTYAKPDKEPYVKSALALGIQADDFSRVLVLEDSKPGIRSAQSAGMKPLGVLSKHSKAEMQALGVDLVIEEIGCLREILGLWS